MSLLIFLATLLGFQAAPGPAIDNPRVQVREVGVSTETATFDSVWVSRAGKAGFVRRGGKLKFDGPGILIGLKDFIQPPLVNKSGYPLAMPRPGSTKLIENARVIVWDYTTRQGVATPMHFHDKDVVIMYLEDGALQSTTPAGDMTLNEFKPGLFRFNPRDRSHSETLIKGQLHAIITELK